MSTRRDMRGCTGRMNILITNSTWTTRGLLYTLQIQKHKYWPDELRKTTNNSDVRRTLCFPWSLMGKHMSHRGQWKKFSAGPTRQRPQPSQWYWWRSSSLNRLQISQKYWKQLRRVLVNMRIQWENNWGISITLPNIVAQERQLCPTGCLSAQTRQTTSFTS